MNRTPVVPPRERRPVRPALAGLATVTMLLLMGCTGGSGDDTSTDVAPITRPTSTSATASETPEVETVADPVSVHAPDANIDTTLIPVGLDEDGAMELPDPGTGAWYELGPRPGEPGPAVVIGHVDSDAGPDVFYGLSSLDEGDVVTVADAKDEQYEFEVESIEVVEKDALPYERIWTDSSEPLLRLITCGGNYDAANGGYQHNVVAYATFAEDS